MVVPGSVLSGRNSGSHSLLKDGARVVESADDILGGLGWLTPDPPGTTRGTVVPNPVLDRMEPGESYRLDELVALTGLTGPKLLPMLMELELQGRVAASPAGTFSRTARDGLTAHGSGLWERSASPAPGFRPASDVLSGLAPKSRSATASECNLRTGRSPKPGPRSLKPDA
jgi:hypothetical protein